VHACGILESRRLDRRIVQASWLNEDLARKPLNTSPEPFGVAFIEVLYAGLPIVTSKIGGGAEIVDDGCGLLTSLSYSHSTACWADENAGALHSASTQRIFSLCPLYSGEKKART